MDTENELYVWGREERRLLAECTRLARLHTEAVLNARGTEAAHAAVEKAFQALMEHRAKKPNATIAAPPPEL